MKTKLNIAIVALAATMTSCYDVLDKVPTDRYTDAVVWNDPALLDMYLAELYACTPVMINDATCLYDSSPMNRDGNDWGTVMGYSEQRWKVLSECSKLQMRQSIISGHKLICSI